MRISDWSSDVCSSDLYGVAARLRAEREPRIDAFRELGAVEIDAPLPPEPADNTYQYGGRFPDPAQLGRASCRERVCQYVYISVVAVSLKKKQILYYANYL